MSRPATPVPDTSLTAYVLGTADRHPDTVAAVDVDGNGGYTYAELGERIRRVAGGLRGLGFARGDALAVLAPNVPEYPVVYHGAVTAGAAVVVLNPIDTVDDLAHHLTEARVRVLVTTAADADKAAELADRTCVEHVVVIGESPVGIPFATLLAAEPLTGDVGIEPAKDVSTVLHSSGSTGTPKGVLLSHRNMISNVLQISQGAPLAEGERVLAVPPFHHAFGLVMVMNSSLLQGATIVTLPRFSPEAFLAAIERHRITRLYVVPTMAVLLAKSPLVDRYDISSVREIVSGGAALAPETARAVRERLGCGIAQGYGLTEGLVSFAQMDFDEEFSGSVGPAATNVETRIVDIRTGAELAAGEVGEVLVRGPHVMLGYLNAEESTRAVLEPDGFLHTGDVGRFDERGELHLVDRIKELIKYKGQQVSPVELEAVLARHPRIADAAVIGVPDEEASEVPKAFVVPSGPITAEEIISWVAQQVAPYKKVRQVEFVEQIPRTPVGKIERRTLRERRSA